MSRPSTSESQQFAFFLQAATELADKLARHDTHEAKTLYRVMRGFEGTFQQWGIQGRPNEAPEVISDFLTASRDAMAYLAKA